MNADTLRGWCKTGRDRCRRAAGYPHRRRAKIKQLEAENRELKRANGILLAGMSAS